MIFGGITVMLFILNLFKNSIQDGSDLLISAKLLTRVQTVWTKIIILLLFNFLVSILLLLLSLPLLFDYCNFDGSAVGVLIGSFIGTLVSFKNNKKTSLIALKLATTQKARFLLVNNVANNKCSQTDMFV